MSGVHLCDWRAASRRRLGVLGGAVDSVRTHIGRPGLIIDDLRKKGQYSVQVEL